MENIKKIVNFLFELAGAKTTPRSGWQRIGIKAPESLADHSALSGQIAYVLALMEGANPDRAAALSIFHDTAELRVGDRNWVTRAYCADSGRMKDEATNDQLSGVPGETRMKELFDEMNERKTKESQVASDADLLDMAIQSKIYAENGNKKALLWFESIKTDFNTGSAKEIYSSLGVAGIEDWWMELESIKEKFGSPR
jgi:putative hydrolase of HD superfamily